MIVYLDESGDLGWKFGQPYLMGGSSRYLALAFMFMPNTSKHASKNVIRSLYKKYGWKSEKKASQATINQKMFFCEKATALIERRPEINLDVIIVEKQNVFPHIRRDSNKIYNYMSGLVIPDHITNDEDVLFVPDERGIKVQAGNSIEEYLEIKIWFERKLPARIQFRPGKSHEQYNLQFVDWLAHCIWIKYEFGESRPHKALSPYIKIRPLYFTK